MADIFVSYAREERARCEKIVDHLSKLGLSVWFDAHNAPGQSFGQEINREARSAKAMLVLWSKAAVNSPWVLAESTIGWERGILVPLQLEPCELPAPFTIVQAEQFFDVDFAEDHPVWLKVIDRIQALVHQPGLQDAARARARQAGRRRVLTIAGLAGAAILAIGSFTGGVALQRYLHLKDAPQAQLVGGPSAEEVALQMIGAYVEEGASCDGERMDLMLGGGADARVLNFVGEPYMLDARPPENNRVHTVFAEGVEFWFGRNGDVLEMTAGPDPSANPFRRFQACAA